MATRITPGSNRICTLRTQVSFPKSAMNQGRRQFSSTSAAISGSEGGRQNPFHWIQFLGQPGKYGDSLKLIVMEVSGLFDVATEDS